MSFHVIHACAPVCCSLSVFPHPAFYFLVLFLFQLYLMSNSAPDEFSIEDPLCNSSLGSMVTLDYVTPLTLSAGDSSKNYVADQQRLQISDLHFDKFPTPATFAFRKIRFKTEVCTCSQFPTETMQWIKEVWSWLIQWMNEDLRRLFVIFQCRILKYLMRGLLQY